MQLEAICTDNHVQIEPSQNFDFPQVTRPISNVEYIGTIGGTGNFCLQNLDWYWIGLVLDWIGIFQPEG